MKSKTTLSIDSELVEEINHKAKLDKRINLSEMVVKFLDAELKTSKPKRKSFVSGLGGILKEAL